MLTENDILKLCFELLITIAAFLVGRYILPKYKVTIQHYATEFAVILSYAESFVAYARQFLTDLSGEEKMNAVIKKLKEICDTRGIVVDEETLRAIAQKAYDAMKAGEQSSKVIIETAVNELTATTGYIKPVIDSVLETNIELETVPVDPFEDDTK